MFIAVRAWYMELNEGLELHEGKVAPFSFPLILDGAKLATLTAMDKGSGWVGHFNQYGFILRAQVDTGDIPRGWQFKNAAVEVQDSRIGNSHAQKVGLKKPSKNGIIHTNAGRAT